MGCARRRTAELARKAREIAAAQSSSRSAKRGEYARQFNVHVPPLMDDLGLIGFLFVLVSLSSFINLAKRES